ncbi:hypothetical protein [Paenibacillus sp. JGP012]|uniref:hypothetical protein n=1 Tax=Paenibacillus sp. JGP012 TaxID=2735914 RepID=UPI00161377C7|nr:hypothetical protein [Paenibacillus sp. JGP012]
MITKDFDANFDAVEFNFTMGDAAVADAKISVWGRDQNGELVTAHRLVSSELIGAGNNTTGETGATGATGETGVSGATGATGAPAVSSLFFASQPALLDLPLAGTITLGSITVNPGSIPADDLVKLDFTSQIAVVVEDNWSFDCNITLTNFAGAGGGSS